MPDPNVSVISQDVPPAGQDAPQGDASQMSPFEYAMTTGQRPAAAAAAPAVVNNNTSVAPAVANTPPAVTAAESSKPKLPTIGEQKKEVTPEPLFNDPPPEGSSPKAAESWKAAKQKWQTQYEQAVAAHKAELEAARKATPQAPPDYEDLKKRATEYETELKRVALERTPEFKKHYETRFNQAEQLARSAVPKEKGDLVAKLLKFSDVEGVEAQLEAVAAELTPLQAGKLANAVQQYQAAKLEREGALADSANQLKFAEEHNIKLQQQQEAAMQKEVETMTNRALELSKGLESFQPREKDDAHNKGIAAREEFVRNFWKGNVPEEMKPWIPSLVADALYMRETMIPSMKAEVEQLKATLASYTKGTPSLNGGVGGLGAKEAPSQTGSKFMDTLLNGLQGS